MWIRLEAVTLVGFRFRIDGLAQVGGVVPEADPMLSALLLSRGQSGDPHGPSFDTVEGSRNCSRLTAGVMGSARSSLPWVASKGICRTRRSLGRDSFPNLWGAGAGLCGRTSRPKWFLGG